MNRLSDTSRQRLFIYALMAFSLVLSGQAAASSWSTEATLISQTAVAETGDGTARLLVDFAQGNQCEPEIILMIQGSPQTSGKKVGLGVDKRGQYESDIQTITGEQYAVSFTKKANDLVSDLRKGYRASVSIPGENAIRFSLSGSSSAISFAQKRCKALQ